MLSMDGLSIEDKVKKHLTEHFLVDFGSEATDSTDLFQTGLIDSFGFVELIQFLEKEFHVTFSDEDLVSNQLSTTANMCALIRKKHSAD